MPETSERRSGVRDFDLNVERVLEGWSVSHALRELIANAIDEQALSGTAPAVIRRVDHGTWSIRDYGRGLRYTHLTQNENEEKQRRESDVIGRFGVGLKDALAVLDRRGVPVELRSGHGVITLVHHAKAGFEDVTTLHARVAPASDPRMIGTEIIVKDIEDAVMDEAKGYFLRFSDETELESTRLGTILARRPGATARIYVKGLVVAEEAEFAFSYNITALTQAMRRALNRERTNVGRTAYTDRVKGMLLAASSPAVAQVLADDLANIAAGTSHEEVRSWSDVGVRACQILNATRRVVFVTAEQLVSDKELIDRAIGDGRDVITVPGTIGGKLATVVDTAGAPLQSLSQFAVDWSESVEYQFVGEDELTRGERAVFGRWREIAALNGGVPAHVTAVLISETMRPSVTEGLHPAGLWEHGTGRIIIHRPQLATLSGFAGTLLHELTHARTGYGDVSREFELALTDGLGRCAGAALR